MPELFFLPGWACGPSIWTKQDFLAKKHQCCFVDLKAFWDLETRTPDFVPDFAENLTELVTRFKNPVLIAWSMGSLLALEVLLKKTAKNIQGLILVAATARFTTIRGYAGGLPPVVVKRMQKNLHLDQSKTLAKFYKQMFTEDELTGGFIEKLADLHYQNKVQFNNVFLQAGLNYLLNTDLRPNLANGCANKMPVLLIHGSADRICPLSGGETLATLLTSAVGATELVVLPRTGHVPFFTAAEEFNTIVQNFLSRLDD
ncbi:MAG: alpha/beta hydrolase [Desulfotomaculum sp.]|nr:alpha/beta hydrolase [Desulfotomaculum sp.]